MKTRRHAVHLIAVFAFLIAIAGTGREAPGSGDSETKTWRLTAEQRAAVEALGPKLVEAITSKNAAARKRLVGDIYATESIARDDMEKIAGQLARINETYPDLAFGSVELSEWNRGGEVSRALHVYARPPGEKLWRDIQVFVSNVPPYRLDRIAFIAETSEPVYLPNGAIDSPATLEWLNAYVDRQVKDYDLSGSLLIAVGDRVICERAFGFADAARTRPITTETLFSMASSSKMFTALAVARLVEDGKLSYDDTIDRFLPEFPDRGFAAKATIGQLLSHTSGVGEYWTEETQDAVRKAASTADFLPLVYRAGVRFEPGTRFEYSNSNFILAGLVIEKVAGRTFDAFIADLITKALGMKNTGYFRTDDSSRPRADFLTRGADGWIEAPGGSRGSAAGGCFSTPRDLLLFVQGLNAGRIVSMSTLGTMLESKNGHIPGADTNYGYGFILEHKGGAFSWGHGGIAGGINAEVRHFPGQGVTMIVFSNQDNGAYDDLRKNVSKLISGDR